MPRVITLIIAIVLTRGEIRYYTYTMKINTRIPYETPFAETLSLKMDSSLLQSSTGESYDAMTEYGIPPAELFVFPDVVL